VVLDHNLGEICSPARTPEARTSTGIMAASTACTGSDESLRLTSPDEASTTGMQARPSRRATGTRKGNPGGERLDDEPCRMGGSSAASPASSGEREEGLGPGVRQALWEFRQMSFINWRRGTRERRGKAPMTRENKNNQSYTRVSRSPHV
jgi:hypothetical protein